jgi:hypothetical protein
MLKLLYLGVPNSLVGIFVCQLDSPISHINVLGTGGIRKVAFARAFGGWKKEICCFDKDFLSVWESGGV